MQQQNDVASDSFWSQKPHHFCAFEIIYLQFCVAVKKKRNWISDENPVSADSYSPSTFYSTLQGAPPAVVSRQGGPLVGFGYTCESLRTEFK